MKKFLFPLFAFLTLCILPGCKTGKTSTHRELEDTGKNLVKELEGYIADKDARIGIAVIIDGKDTVTVNGKKEFPMLSLYKFPQAIAVADYCERKHIAVSDTVSVEANELKPDTWSPLRDKYGCKDIKLTLSELLTYSLQKSDNNACDILFRLIGGPEKADSLIKNMGFNKIHILNTESELNRDPYLCYANRTTPLEMAALFDLFYRQGLCKTSLVLERIGEIMMTCTTGLTRLPAPLASQNVSIGHKTGTGGKNSQGRIIAINDAGYVFLPNNRGYSIAVLIADSGYDMEETEKIIAGISEIVFRELNVN